jgi:hypothetical protein
VSLRGRRRSGERAPVAGSSRRCRTGPEKAAGKLGGVEAVDDLELMGPRSELCRRGCLDVEALGQGLCHGVSRVGAEYEKE